MGHHRLSAISDNRIRACLLPLGLILLRVLPCHRELFSHPHGLPRWMIGLHLRGLSIPMPPALHGHHHTSNLQGQAATTHHHPSLLIRTAIRLQSDSVRDVAVLGGMYYVRPLSAGMMTLLSLVVSFDFALSVVYHTLSILARSLIGMTRTKYLRSTYDTLCIVYALSTLRTLI